MASSDSERQPYRARWTRAAVRDLENTHAFIRQEDAAAARRWAAAILRAVKRLVDHPESGSVADDLRPVGSYQHAVVGRHRIIYMLDQDAVVVVRVWDSRRNPDDLTVP